MKVENSWEEGKLGHTKCVGCLFQATVVLMKKTRLNTFILLQKLNKGK